MKRCKYSSRQMTSAAIAVVVIAAGSAFAQTSSVDQVLQADMRRLELAQESQERINEVVEVARSLSDDYRAINKEIDGLKVYNRLMTAQTNGQTATLDDIALSMEQVDVINRQIFPLMERMIDGIEQSVSLDIPFLMAERTKRVNDLKNIMERSDVSVAEKFRKVMEAGYRGFGGTQGFFPQVSGFRVCVDRHRKEGDRIVSLQVPDGDLWTEIDHDKVFSLVVPDFLYGGGDGYEVPHDRPVSRPGSELIYLVLDGILDAQSRGEMVGKAVDPEDPRYHELLEAKQPCFR